MCPKCPMCKDKLVDYHDTMKYFGSEFFHMLSYIMFEVTRRRGYVGWLTLSYIMFSSFFH